MIKSNGDFIYKCRLCGKTDMVMSELTLKTNYGSSYFEQLSNEREAR